MPFSFFMKKSPLRRTINRCAIILQPKQPALDWIKKVDPEDMGLTLADLCKDQDVFLLSEEFSDSEEDARQYIDKQWETFFERFLVSWYTDPDLWPPKRTLKLFKEWFDIQYHSMVWDLAEEPIRYEDWEDGAA